MYGAAGKGAPEKRRRNKKEKVSMYKRLKKILSDLLGMNVLDSFSASPSSSSPFSFLCLIGWLVLVAARTSLSFGS